MTTDRAIQRPPIEQAVILCGGRGSRLASELGDLPKILVEVAGSPLLAHLLAGLAQAGLSEVLLLAGTGGVKVQAAAAAFAPAGLDVHTEIEPGPRGTAGALHGVSSHLAQRFLLLFGDVYAAVDWRRFLATAASRASLACLLVHRSSHPDDSDVVALDDTARVIGWIGRDPARRHMAAVSPAALTNAAVAVVHRDLLRYVPTDRAADLYGEVLPGLVAARAPVHAYLSSEFVRDLGTPERLAAVRAAVQAGTAWQRAEGVLLDRDGVLTKEIGPIASPADITLIPGAARGLRRLNQAGIRTALITNQAVVARGLCSQGDLTRIHARLTQLLAAKGARLDGVYTCVHHPETHHLEGVPELRGPCPCRKPSTGLVDQALTELGIAPWRAALVGDRSLDMQTAWNAGLPGIAVESGFGCSDDRFPARPVWHFPDLDAATQWIVGTPLGAHGT